MSEIPTEGWQDMATAPRDGTVFAVRFHPWNNKANPPQVQSAQWLWTTCGGAFCLPYQIDSRVYADGWMTFEALNALVKETER